jgi:hypothetical protein
MNRAALISAARRGAVLAVGGLFVVSPITPRGTARAQTRGLALVQQHLRNVPRNWYRWEQPKPLRLLCAP